MLASSSSCYYNGHTARRDSRHLDFLAVPKTPHYELAHGGMWLTLKQLYSSFSDEFNVPVWQKEGAPEILNVFQCLRRWSWVCNGLCQFCFIAVSTSNLCLHTNMPKEYIFFCNAQNECCVQTCSKFSEIKLTSLWSTLISKFCSI